MRRSGGFTLVEVLVALAIVGVALGAVLRTLGVGVDGVLGMRERSLAQWAAENRLAELRLQRTLLNPGEYQQPCPQGALALVCQAAVRASANSQFRQVTVRVRLSEEGPVLAELHGLLSSLP